MALLEHLHQNSEVPIGTKVNTARQLREHLFNQLLIMLSTKFEWYAMCTIAVEAGYHIANKKQHKRLRIKGLIDMLSEYIGDESPCKRFPYGWEELNMVYGYSTCDKAYASAILNVMFGDNIRIIGECDIVFNHIKEHNKRFPPDDYALAKKLSIERRIPINEALIRLNAKTTL